MPLPMMSHLNVSLEQRLENINRVEATMKERGYYEGEELKLMEAKNRLLKQEGRK
jgi:hypothetical protein